MMKLPTAYDIVLTPAKEERFSQIIREINSRTGRQYDNDVAIKAALQIRDIMKKSEELKTSAKNNSEQDFEFAYFDHVDDALIDGLEQNQDFFTLLLQNDEIYLVKYPSTKALNISLATFNLEREMDNDSENEIELGILK